MMFFLIPALCILLLSLAFLLRPLFFRKQAANTSRRQMNAAIYREELDKLELDRQAGEMDATNYEMAHAELRQRLFQDTQEVDDQASFGSIKKTITFVCLSIFLLSSGIYFYQGDAVKVAEENAKHQVSQADVEKMVSEFAAKLEKDPTNLKGWAMLARSYRVMGRNADALKAYERAGPYLDNQAELLADYADLLATNASGNFAGKPHQLIAQALKLDPNNLLALWLAGSDAFSTNQFQLAVQNWEKIVKQLPPQSEEARAVLNSIAEARAKGHLPVPLAVAGKGVSGVITITPELASRIKPDELLMVIARKPGERMPVAVLKTPVSAFPIRFTLDDSLAMNPAALISQQSEVTVEVRISKTGMAKAEAGDLLSGQQTVKVGSSNIRLTVDQVQQ
ncbi:c-type cytochrome biogenesis protein CcmI [Polynucleobacter paludilacus]|uniref:c-type cytochrome biogenesis protein CcmI n=1 Tax=Polynucleobacter paludilacus TaxID=1855895 RepID=UPI001BFE9A43|nr:c-type cytochrome biogenesis protein CcmI [Polynucleobacter paludilacus]QWD86648.1 c-type cytochrome biogenesis protein CcmI [Polynucleobacter paludilacus]